jgi:tripartite ATP-independent transporter DctM subunit
VSDLRQALPAVRGVSEPKTGRPLAARGRSGLAGVVHIGENAFANAALAIMTLLPILEIVGRRLLGQGVPGSVLFVQSLTLWVAFLGAMIAARQRRHLALATTAFLPASVRGVGSLVASAVSTGVTAILAWTAVHVVLNERTFTSTLGWGIPKWIAVTIMPVGFAIVALRMWWQSGSIPTGEGHDAPAPEARLASWHAWGRRAIVAGVLVALWAMRSVPADSAAAWTWPLVIVILGAAVLGAPIFVALGGMAVVLFFGNAEGAGPISMIPDEAYSLVTSATLPAIPLFTLAGSLLAEGGTPARLVRLFRALAGWLPGGTAVAAVLVCAFFTTFTGASGVTILALGGLLLPVLVRDVYGDRFSLGAVTSAGSIGLLFPPSLPVILYAISAQTPVDKMFVAAIVPGLVLVGLVSAYCIREGIAKGATWKRPQPNEVLAALWDAKWEVALPVVVFVSLFGGFATTVEAAALTAFYAFLIKCFVHRDLGFRHDLPRVLRESAVLVGGVLIILGCARGLANYLTIAQIPDQGAAWVQSAIQSRWVFLLALNGFLLIVGCLMDIFSAIFVVVPLILPIARAFHVDPIHLGVIFLINLELGYLTPPVGMNLFLSSYRFNKSMLTVTRAVLPFMAVQLASVLLVTYLPALSVGVVNWLMP